MAMRPHVLGHGDHWHVDGSRHSFGRAVPSSGLVGLDRRVGNEVDIGPGDSRRIGSEDDGSVHLRELGQALWRERVVQLEATRADAEHLVGVAYDDERTALCLQDPIEPFPQRLARRDRRDRLQPGIATGYHENEV